MCEVYSKITKAPELCFGLHKLFVGLGEDMRLMNNTFRVIFSELISQFRPARRGGRQGYQNNKPRGGGNSRLRSIDSEQHLFSPTNRLVCGPIVITCNCIHNYI